MCRMLTYVSRTPRTVEQAVTPEQLPVVTALSHDHKDGWGVGWRDPAGDVAVVKGADPAWRDDRYLETVTGVASDQLLVHLRKASPGMVVELVNCHPFTDGEVLFCHNGEFAASQRLRASVAERGGRPCAGTTDSELYLALVLLHARTLPWAEAIAAAVREICDDLRLDDPQALPLALNCFVLTGTRTFAYGHHEPSRLRPTTHRDFFRLQWACDDDQVVVASSLWPLPRGSAAPDRQVIEIDRATLAVTVHPPVLG